MSRKFVTEREIAFINNINHELIQAVIGQEVQYYAISLPETRVHDIYNESIEKTWSPPVTVNALVRYDNPTVLTTQFGLDAEYSLEVYFHTQELGERNVLPKEGDFVEFGQVFFEISSVTQPQIVFGQVNNKVMTKCVCVKSRESQFRPGGTSEQNDVKDHPVEQSMYNPR